MYALEKALMPYPQRVTKNGGDTVIGTLHSANFAFTAEQNDSPVYAEAIALMQKTFAQKLCITEYNCDAAYKITLRIAPDAPEFADVDRAEAYAIKITDTEAPRSIRSVLYSIFCEYTEKVATSDERKIEYTNTYEKNSEADSVVAFLWDGLDSMNPILRAKIAE